MPLLQQVQGKIIETLKIYWVLVRVTVPIAICTEILARLGFIKLLAPAFGPVMDLLGLPAELGLAWLMGMLLGLWGAVPLLFTLVPVSTLTVADVTVLSALLLFAHGLPIEQKIIQKAGPALLVTTLLRLVGGLTYAFLLHRVLAATGWLSGVVDPVWIPLTATPDWERYLFGLAEAMMSMLFILFALSLGLDILRITGVLGLMMKMLAPLLHLAGIRGEAGPLTAVGLFLGISYGGALLIREAQSTAISPRQIVLSCVFMGFAHSVVEDSLLVMSLGADIYGVLVGRLVFAVAATAALAMLLRRLTDAAFFAYFFNSPGRAVCNEALEKSA